jgi:nitrogen fixation protein FixH
MKKGMGWPIGITVILLATVASNVGVVLLTKDDPSFAVEPDYYRKAVTWDSMQLVRARSDALAWQVAANVTNASAERATLSLALTDSTGAAVEGATIAGELRHLARAADVQLVTFTATPDGHYAASVPMARAGVWELRVTADRGAARFLHTVRIDTSAPDNADAGTGGP